MDNETDENSRDSMEIDEDVEDSTDTTNDPMDEEDSSDSLELFPIVTQNETPAFDYSDPMLVSGVLRAVVKEDLKDVKSLVQSGRSVNINDNIGFTPLHVAVIKNNAKILEYLLSRDEIVINNKNFFGETPLYLACKNGHANIATKLIQAGAEINTPNDTGMTPLHASTNHPKIAHILIENGAKINAQDFNGDTPLHQTIFDNSLGLEALEVLCMLLYYNADANVPNDDGFTPFMKALIAKDAQKQRALFKYVDDFSYATIGNLDILYLALVYKSSLVGEIIESGADVNDINVDLEEEYHSLDAFAVCTRVPSSNNFQLVWDKYEDDVSDEQGSILYRLSEGNLKKTQLLEYINIIMESNNISTVVETNDAYLDLNVMISAMFYKEIPLELVTKFTCLLCSYGFAICSTDLDTIYQHYGYCELFKILLNLDFYQKNRATIFPRIIYDVRKTTTQIVHDFLEIESSVDFIYAVKTAMPLFNYCAFPKLVSRLFLFSQGSTISYVKPLFNRIEKLPQVPLLLDLARNEARDFIIKKYKINKTSQYFSIVNNALNISNLYKRLLTYEEIIYC